MDSFILNGGIDYCVKCNLEDWKEMVDLVKEKVSSEEAFHEWGSTFKMVFMSMAQGIKGFGGGGYGGHYFLWENIGPELAQKKLDYLESKW